MSAPRTHAQMKAAISLVEAHGTIDAAALASGMPRQTFRDHYHAGLAAARRGEFGTDPVIPSFEISRVSTTADADGNIKSKSVQQRPAKGEVFENPEGFEVKKLSVLTDSDGRLSQKWAKYDADKLSLATITEHVLGAFTDLDTRHISILSPADTYAEMLTLYPLADLHLGLYAWAAETGMNWDLSIAVAKYKATMVRVASCTLASAVAVVLIGGDFLHANTNEFRTSSGNVLDGDGRTDKVIDAGVDLAVFQIDLALSKHGRVVVRVLKGNHDEYASIAIVQGLKAWYRNEPRVTVDGNPDLYWWYQHGKVLLGGTHGHTVKVEAMPMIMAARNAVAWGGTEFRYIHMFHIHHKTRHVFEGGAVIAESHQSPAAQDNYHHSAGYLAGRSMQSITYSDTLGEFGRTSFPVL